MQHVEESKFGDARDVSAETDPLVSPFVDPGNSQFGIVPGGTEPPDRLLAEASAPPATQAAEDMVGTPAELRARNAHLQNAQPTRFGPSPPQSPATPASTVPLGYSPARQQETHPANDMHLRQAVRRGPGTDETESDILLSLARQPVEQRLLALEQYVFEQHARDLFFLEPQDQDFRKQDGCGLG